MPAPEGIRQGALNVLLRTAPRAPGTAPPLVWHLTLSFAFSTVTIAASTSEGLTEPGLAAALRRVASASVAAEMAAGIGCKQRCVSVVRGPQTPCATRYPLGHGRPGVTPAPWPLTGTGYNRGMPLTRGGTRSSAWNDGDATMEALMSWAHRARARAGKVRVGKHGCK